MGLNDGLVGLYHFTGNANDDSNNGNNGTVNGATLTADKNGVSNQAYDFDGTNDYIATGIIIQPEPFNITGWFNLDAIGGTELYVFGNGNTGTTNSRCRLYVKTNGVVEAAIGDAIVTSTFGAIQTGKWYFFSTGWDGTNGFLNINATYNDETTRSFDNAPNTGIDIGQYGTSSNIRYWNGKIDEIRIYNRVLGSQEVQELYQGYDTDEEHVGTIDGPSESITTLDTGLVAGYHFSNNANDFSGNGNNGTINGSVNATTDRNGVSNQAYDFTGGTNDNISLGTSLMTTSPFTFSSWFKSDNLSGNHNIMGRNASVYLGTVGSQLYYRIYNGSWFNVIIPFTDTTNWNMASMSWDGSTLVAYLNGEEVGSVAVPSMIGTGNTLYLGGYNPTGDNRGWDGKLDEARIYNRVLADSEIKALYQNYDSEGAVNLNNSGLLAKYHFTGNANDSSSNANNGTVNGATLTTGKNGNANSAYSFDDTNDSIDLSTPLVTSGNISASAWVKSTSTNSGCVISSYDFVSSQNRGWEFGINRSDGGANSSGRIYLGIGTSNFYKTVSEPNVNNGEWQHIVWTVDTSNNEGKIYFNGALVFTVALTAGSYNLDSGKNASIGKRTFSTGDNFFGGTIDEVRVYDRVLTGFEAQQLYQGYDVDESCEPLLGPQENQSITGMNTGLVAAYDFNGNADDWSGNGNNGTVVGATLTTDRDNQNNRAYSFDSVDDHIDCNSSLVTTTTAFSTSFWMYKTDTDNAIPLGNGDNDNGWYFRVQTTNTQIRNRFGTSNWDINYTIDTNKWYHVATTFDGTTYKLFINNEFVGSNNFTPVAANDNMWIGDFVRSGGNTFGGTIDEVRIYNRVLTETEIKTLYQNYDAQDNDLPLDESGLAAYYPFSGNANDASVNKNDGVVNGATLTTDRNGESNSAYDFNGSSNYISLPNLDMNNSFTVNAWVNGDTFSANNIIFYQGNDGTGVREFFQLLYNNSNNKFQFEYDLESTGGTTSGSGTTSPSTGTWYMVTFTRDVNGNDTLYVNGVAEYSAATQSGKVKSYNVATRIGVLENWSTGAQQQHFDGKIDEFRVYDRVLTQHEIEALYFGYDEPNVCPVAPTPPPQPGAANNAPFFGAGL